MRAVVDYALGSNDRYTSLIGHDEQGQVRTLRLSYHRSSEGSGWDRTKGQAAHPKRDDEFVGERFASDDERAECLVCHVTSPRRARAERSRGQRPGDRLRAVPWTGRPSSGSGRDQVLGLGHRQPGAGFAGGDQ